MFYTILFTFLIFVAIAAMLAIGLFFGKKKIPSSCASISNLGIKRACDCKDPCSDYNKSKVKKSSGFVDPLEDSSIDKDR